MAGSHVLLEAEAEQKQDEPPADRCLQDRNGRHEDQALVDLRLLDVDDRDAEQDGKQDDASESTAENARAASPNPAASDRRMLDSAIPVPTKNIPVARATPAMPSSRCRATAPEDASDVCFRIEDVTPFTFKNSLRILASLAARPVRRGRRERSSQRRNEENEDETEKTQPRGRDRAERVE